MSVTTRIPRRRDSARARTGIYGPFEQALVVAEVNGWGEEEQEKTATGRPDFTELLFGEQNSWVGDTEEGGTIGGTVKTLYVKS